MKTNAVIATARQDGKLHFCPVINPEIILVSEKDFGPACLCSQLVSLDDGEVDNPLLRAEVFAALDDDIPLDIGKTGEALVIVFPLLGVGDEGPEKGQSCEDHSCLFHFRSPSNPIHSKSCAKWSPLKNVVFWGGMCP